MQTYWTKPHTPVVVQFNALAQSLATDFPLCDERYLTWEHRAPRIVEAVRAAGATVACLEEVDEEHVEPLREALGAEWSVHFHRKGEWHRDGTAIFRRDAPPVREVVAEHYKDEEGREETQFYLIVVYEDMVVAATHLRAKPPHEQQRVRQLQQLTAALFDVTCRFDMPDRVVVCMDANAEPHGPAYQVMRQQYRDAYEDSDLEYTTWKARRLNDVAGDGKSVVEVKHVIDYIFLSFNAHVKRVLMPQRVLGKELLPSRVHPSDHVVLAVKFRWS